MRFLDIFILVHVSQVELFDTQYNIVPEDTSENLSNVGIISETYIYASVSKKNNGVLYNTGMLEILKVFQRSKMSEVF